MLSDRTGHVFHGLVEDVRPGTKYALRVHGAWDPAATRLSLHRNTVRNRIDRIARLTGRRLDDGDDRMELWLALKARAALPQ